MATIDHPFGSVLENGHPGWLVLLQTEPEERGSGCDVWCPEVLLMPWVVWNLIVKKKGIVSEKLAGQPAFVMAYSLEQRAHQGWNEQVMYLERSPWEVAVAISPVSHPSVPPTLFPTSADDLIYLGIYMATSSWAGENSPENSPRSASSSLRCTREYPSLPATRLLLSPFEVTHPK